MDEVIIVNSNTDKTFEEENRPLVIFKTDEDKYKRDITSMSDFFDGYVQQMASSIREQSNFEVI